MDLDTFYGIIVDGIYMVLNIVDGIYLVFNIVYGIFLDGTYFLFDISCGIVVDGMAMVFLSYDYGEQHVLNFGIHGYDDTVSGNRLLVCLVLAGHVLHGHGSDGHGKDPRELG
jgi:hypothetical protein